MKKPIYDKNGVLIEEFDVLRVFHSFGKRGKKLYTYRLVLKKRGRLYGSFLNTNPLLPQQLLDGNCHLPQHVEIIQSINWEKIK